MVAFKYLLNAPQEAESLGAQLSPLLRVGDVIALIGPLGAGKTTLARGLIRAFAGVDEAPSPTYGFVETYPGEACELWHFDLYRLEKPEDVYELGIEEALAEGATLIEWPERIAGLLPAGALRLELEITDAQRRIAHLSGEAAWAERLQAGGIVRH